MRYRNATLYVLYRASRSAVFERGFLAIYLTQVGISAGDLGLLMSVLFISVLLSEIPTGVFSDRFGRAMSVSVGLILCALYPVGMLFADSFAFVAVLFLILGFGRSFVSGSDHSLIYEHMKSKGLELAFPKIEATASAISALILGLSILCGGLLAQYSWTYLYLAFAAASTVSFIVWQTLAASLARDAVARGARETTRPVAGSAPAKRPRNLLSFLFRSRTGLRYIGIVAAISLLCLGLGPIFFYAQPMLLDNGLSLVQIGIVVGLIELGASVPAWITSRVENKFTYAEILTAYCGIGCLALVMASLETSASIAIAIALVLWVGPIFNIASMHALHRVLPSTHRTTLFSLASTTFSLATAAGFTIYGLLIEGLGWSNGLRTLLVLPILALAVGLTLDRATRVRINDFSVPEGRTS